MEELLNAITQIGNQMVFCNLNCAGICNNPANGIIPRCLYFDNQNRQGQVGCVLIGINPGRSANQVRERNFYLENQLSYNTINDFWVNHGGYNHVYYRYLRDFINCIGFDGPILWTELVKCENAIDVSQLPLETFRKCINNYLINELSIIPENWPIIAAGRKPFEASSYLFMDRFVIGVPHPNSRGNFSNMFTNAERNHFENNVQVQVNNILNDFNNNNRFAIWIES